MLSEPWLTLGIIAIPFAVHLCAKIAARAWFQEKRRFHHAFMHDLEER